jgi:hypothetical protein
MCPAAGVTATVFWSEVATLVTPSAWTRIGTSAPVAVPAGELLTVTPAIPWLAAQIPAPGHYCFIAIVGHPYDPEPPPLGPTDWTGFQTYLRDHNNVAWRNFNVISPASLNIGAWFWIRGAPDQIRYFDFEIIQALPQGLRLSLEIPLALLGALRGPFVKRFVMEGDEKRVLVALPPGPLVRVPAVRLGQDAHYRCRFVWNPDEPPNKRLLAGALGSIAIRQLFEGREVGRITWVLQPKLGKNE